MICSAGSTFPDEGKSRRKRLALRGGLQVCVSKSCAELARQLSPLYGNTPPARPDWGEGRGGGERFPRGKGTEEKTRLQVGMGKLKRTVCEAESVYLLRRGRVWSFAGIHRLVARGGGRTEFSRDAEMRRKAKETLYPARGDRLTEIVQTVPARIGKREFPQAWRAVFSRRNLENLPRASRERTVPGAGSGAGTSNEGKRKSFVPPPAGRACGTRSGKMWWGVFACPNEVYFMGVAAFIPPLRGSCPPFGAPPEAALLPPRFAWRRGRGTSPIVQTSRGMPAPPGIGTSCGKL